MSPSPTLAKSHPWSLRALETLRIWKWNNSEAMKVKFPPPVWNHSNQFFPGWGMAGEREKQSGLQKCEVSQKVLPSPSPSFSCSCYFFWTIDSISSCSSSKSAKPELLVLQTAHSQELLLCPSVVSVATFLFDFNFPVQLSPTIFFIYPCL